jgi:hypothetical protein
VPRRLKGGPRLGFMWGRSRDNPFSWTPYTAKGRPLPRGDMLRIIIHFNMGPFSPRGLQFALSYPALQLWLHFKNTPNDPVLSKASKESKFNLINTGVITYNKYVCARKVKELQEIVYAIFFRSFSWCLRNSRMWEHLLKKRILIS